MPFYFGEVLAKTISIHISVPIYSKLLFQYDYHSFSRTITDYSSFSKVKATPVHMSSCIYNNSGSTY